MPLVVACIGFLAFAGASAARGDVRAALRVCGARACAAVKTTESRLQPLLFDVSSSSRVPPPAGAFYVMKLSVEGAPRVQTGWYVPSAHTTRWLLPGPSEWARLRRRGVEFLRGLRAGPPHDAPRPVRVRAAHRRARDTAPYAHVFDRFPQAPGPPPNAQWVALRVVWPAGTPWRFEHTELSALPAHRVLARRGGWFRIPRAFADVIARDAHR